MGHIVTGGAGFIGSHLVDSLLTDGLDVTVVDDLSTGDRSWVDTRARFIEADVVARPLGDDAPAGPDVETVWHLAADPDVRHGAQDPQAHAQRHLAPTIAVLEAMRRHDIDHIAFTSTSTVYGEAVVRPTPEDYGPMLPISVYGGAKLACEALVSAWCGTYGMRGQLFRFANVVGPRSNHGVTYDFVHKLRSDPDHLEILGDGTQTKSYVHVSDTVSGMRVAASRAGPGCTAWNIGSLDAIPVTEVAKVVADEMGLRPRYSFTGGSFGGAGWAGDVKNMGLAVEALQDLGWSPSYSSSDAVRDTARSLLVPA